MDDLYCSVTSASDSWTGRVSVTALTWVVSFNTVPIIFALVMLDYNSTAVNAERQ